MWEPVAVCGFRAIIVVWLEPSKNSPGSIAQQETEARMLVSDLLEIGIQQRKAYEEAQKKTETEKTPAKKG